MEENSRIIFFEQDKLISKVTNSLRITNKLLPIITEPELIPYRNGDKWGFCTTNKKILIECKFDDVNFFEGHLAKVYINKEYYFIDRNGKRIKKESKIEESFNFENEYDDVEAGLKKKVKKYEISNGLVAVRKNNKFGFVNLRNDIIIPFDYDWDSNSSFKFCYHFPNFKDDVVFLKKNSKWGALDTNGKIVIPFKYDSYGFHDLIDFMMAEGFVENFVNVKLNDKWGIIDKNGIIIIPFEYDMCFNFFENLAVVKLNDKYGVIDKNNRLIVPLIYDEISNFKAGLAKIKNNNKYGLIDNKGNLIIDTRYDILRHYWLIELGYIVVGNIGKIGIIDINGEIIIDFIYEDVVPFNKYRFYVRKNNKWGIIDQNNILLIDFKYDNIEGWKTYNYIRVWNEKKLLGFIDENGTEFWED